MTIAPPAKDAVPEAAAERSDRYQVTVDQYIQFRRQGYLAVKGLVSPKDIAELRQHVDDLMQGRLPEQTIQMPARDTQGDRGTTSQPLAAPPENLSPEEKAQYFLRIHMLHRQLALHEKYLLHPRVLDVLQVLIGPDLLALQTMLFVKGPGKPGQGWHQDSYYIPTFPDSLCGAWIAIDPCDERNGAMWFAAGSQTEPVYPPREGTSYGDRQISDIPSVVGVSNTNDDENDLARVANKYPQLLCPAEPGDVVFFGGHVLHRSKQNWTTDRFRRSFVSHYCSARSFTQWGGDAAAETIGGASVDTATGMANGSHILARGETHLPFSLPRFRTPCAALLTPEERKKQGNFTHAARADMDSGLMGMEPADPNKKDDDGY